MRLAAEERRRARSRDRTLERVAYRNRLAGFGNDRQDPPGAQERRDGHGDRVRRDVVDRCEVALGHLLAAGSGLERDDLDVERIVEVGDRRIVEREMPVLADAAAAQVERVRAQEVGVALGLGLGSPVFPVR